MDENGVMVFPNVGNGGNSSSIDPALLLALQNNGGLGGGYGFIWVIFLWMMWQNGAFGNFRNGGGTFPELVGQMNGNNGREMLAEIMNGRFDNLGQLAQIINTSVETVKTGIFNLNTAIAQLSGTVGLSAAETRNSIERGNAALSQQLCQCCCENHLAISEQTNAIQREMAANHSAAMAQAASNFAAKQLQDAQYHGEDRLDVCQQTNAIVNNDNNNTRLITDAIAAQSIMINDKFCELEKRELQSKINTQADIITQMRGEISNDKQTRIFGEYFNAINERLTRMESRQPNTVPVQYPNLIAANATPFVGGVGYGYGYGYPQNNFWG